MKNLKYALSFLLAAILLASTIGCADNNSVISDDSDFDYASDMQIIYHIGGANVPMTKSESGYYYVGDDDIVIYIDKESKKATPLCSKPNCMHDDPDTCNAYFNFSINNPVDSILGTFGTAIQYYDGSLYMVCGEYDESCIEYNTYLLKVSADGSDREVVTDYFDCSFVDWFIHRGYFYFTSDSSVLRIPLNNLKSEPEILYHTEYYIDDYLGTFQELCAFDDYLYFTVEERDEEENVKATKTIYVNLDTLESGELPWIDEDNQISYIDFADNQGIFSFFDSGSEEVIYYTGELDGSDLQEFYRCSTDDLSYVSSDGEYLYFDNRSSVAKGEEDQQIITIYDLNMNKIDSFEFPETQSDIYGFFNPQDEDYFILEALNDEGERILVMADKSQIGSIGGDTIEYTELCKLDWYEITDAPYVAE